MKPRLVVGLGGELAGDDAVGLVLAERLAIDPRLPADVEVVVGGADLLRLAPALQGRRHVVLVDALVGLPGEVEPLVSDHPLPELDRRQQHAHHLSAVDALDLLRLTDPQLAATRCTWFLVPITDARPAAGVSSALDARLPGLLDQVLAALG